VGSVTFAALSIIIVTCGKKYAFCASCIIGILSESMVSNVPALYLIAYPVITMFCAQYFADMTDRQRERRRMMIENRRVAISAGKGKKHWWQRFMLRYRDTDLLPIVRIPLCAAVMDLIMNVVLILYMYLIGEEWSFVYLSRTAVSVLYTAGLALALMVPLRYVLGMYRFRKRDEGGELM